MKKIILIRGLPNSGKSTKAKELRDLYNPLCKETTPMHLETDKYFTRKTKDNPTGEYKFDASKLGIAHAWNIDRFRECIDNEFEVIIVSNTFTIRKELLPYVAYAHAAGYEIEIIEPSTPWAWDIDECFKKNIHGVPIESLQKMKDRYKHNLTVEEVLNGY